MLDALRFGVQKFPERYRLEILLHSTKNFLATDPKDKIYGFLGLARQGAHGAHDKFEAVYERSVEDAFRCFSIYLLTVEHSTSFYGFLPVASTQRPRLPSWVPDFAPLQDPHQPTLGIAARNWVDVPEHRPDALRLSPCGLELIVKSLLLDKVQDIVRAPAQRQTAVLRAYPQVLFVQLVYFVGFLTTRDTTVLKGFRFASQRSTFSEYMVEFTRAIVAIEALVHQCADRPANSPMKWGTPPTTDGLWTLLLMAKFLMSDNPRMQSFQDREKYRGMFDTWMAAAKRIAKRQSTGWFPAPVDFPENVLSMTSNFTEGFCHGRTFFAGRGGWYGIGEGDIKPGDQLALLFPDVNVPFILRKIRGKFKMIGVANVPEELLAGLVGRGEDQYSELTIE